MQRVAAWFLTTLAFPIRLFGSRGLRRLVGELGNTVRKEIDHIEPVHILLSEEIHGVRILLAENRDEDIRPGHFLSTR